MTRINCIPVEELTNKHLVAEYRELPRVFALARRPKTGEVFPSEYTMGAGHVKFFYDKLFYIAYRFYALIEEMKKRGFIPTYTDPPYHLVRDKTLIRGWAPTDEAMKINRERIAKRLAGDKSD